MTIIAQRAPESKRPRKVRKRELVLRLHGKGRNVAEIVYGVGTTTAYVNRILDDASSAPSLASADVASEFPEVIRHEVGVLGGGIDIYYTFTEAAVATPSARARYVCADAAPALSIRFRYNVRSQYGFGRAVGARFINDGGYWLWRGERENLKRMLDFAAAVAIGFDEDAIEYLRSCWTKDIAKEVVR